MSMTLSRDTLIPWASGFRMITPIKVVQGETQTLNDGFIIFLSRRREIKLKRPNVPTETGMKSLPDSESNSYMDFTNSDLDSDAAQSTVPFFDTQAVTSDPVVPLAGAGIFHKGRDLSGGFVAVKMFTYDFSPHIQLPNYGDANY